MGVNVSVHDTHGGVEMMIRKFSKRCEAEGVLKSIQRHEFYLTKSQRVKAKNRMAKRKNKERLAEEKE